MWYICNIYRNIVCPTCYSFFFHNKYEFENHDFEIFGTRVNTPITKHKSITKHPYSWPMLDQKKIYECCHASLSLNI
jgi:hypothetical protein